MVGIGVLGSLEVEGSEVGGKGHEMDGIQVYWIFFTCC